MQKLVIIEDEPYIRKALRVLIEHFNFEISIIAECASVNEAITTVNATKPDIVLLDINLVDGTGFDFLAQVTKIDFKVIFITAYEEYALKALKVGALDYILKPVNEDELKAALQKSLKRKPESNKQVQIANAYLQGKRDKIILSLIDSYQVIYLFKGTHLLQV